MYDWSNSYCSPTVRSSGVMNPENSAMAYAPAMPAAMLNITSIGIIVTSPAILGSMRKFAEFTPIISKASICWVTRMVPISDVMFEPTLPASIRHIIDEENSRRSTSLVAYPVMNFGIHGLSTFVFICMQSTAPMNTDISSTMGIELTPSLYISRSVWRKNILQRCGMESTCFISIMYLPKVLIESVKTISVLPSTPFGKACLPAKVQFLFLLCIFLSNIRDESCHLYPINGTFFVSTVKMHYLSRQIAFISIWQRRISTIRASLWSCAPKVL